MAPYLTRNIMYKLLLIVSLAYFALAGEDYYKILGVARDADDNTIRKAFKKLTLKYHPDKNLDNKEEAEKKFMKIANAYEVLSDTDKRKIYDVQGEEGLKKSGQQQNQGPFNADNIFSQFFGRQAGGFNQGGFNQGGFNFQFNMGGNQQQQAFHHQQQQQQQPQKSESLYDKTDVLELDLGNLKQLYRRNEI